ncbi:MULTISPECIES: hypothetical protein [unclassified Pseudomonas]|uniref:hypothetical protein n=1 Tax=unclassified Pseudomonas TaxID=196821 RepID=UPI0015AD6919|nr:hypothetical protein [Pseudomonas sp. B10]
MNNVGVAGWKPLNTWLSALWLFFEQCVFDGGQTCLSTFLWEDKTARMAVVNPVDKSVTKLWKDSAKGRNCWPRAIMAMTGRSCKMPCPAQLVVQGQAKNFANRSQSLVWRGFALFHLPPETVEGLVDNVRAHGYRPRRIWRSGR